MSKDIEIEYFREYLRIPSVHPKPNYEPCVEFLKRQALTLSLPMKLYYPVNKDNPIVVLTCVGSEPQLPSILLNSHMDVVPVFPDYWTHPPFAADMDENGRIYARGTQDMKCVGMQYLAALRKLKRKGQTLKRTIHISFVSDEEMGGSLGMREFVKTTDFQSLNIGFALDEGIASPNDSFPVFYGERSVWRLLFQITGNAGHGSLLIKHTPGEKLLYILNKMMTLREHEVCRLKNNPEMKLGDVTSVNLTKILGGVQSNVIPPKMTMCFDVRLAVDVNHKEFENQLNQWCKEAGGDIVIEFEHKCPHVVPTKIDDSNPYWLAFKKAINNLNLDVIPQIFPGGTDSRYIRNVGIPALGFSPMNNTPVLLHDHDEFISADTYLRGIDIYEEIIQNLANI